MGKLILDAILARLDALECARSGNPASGSQEARLAKREGVGPREVDRRRLKRGIYAAPEIENGRLYWWSDSLPSASPPRLTAPRARAARDPRLRSKPAQTPLET